MDLKELLRFVNASVLAKTGKYLNDVEAMVLEGSWNGQNYEEIAEAKGYSDNYLRQDVGPKLWKLLSETFEERVSKTNFRTALERHYHAFHTNLSQKINQPTPQAVLELQRPEDVPAHPITPDFPEGLLAIDSPFYVNRPPIETDCYHEILKPGALIRIKAPRKMGKTSLLSRILAHAEQHQCRVVRVNLRQAEKSIFTNLDKFLRWFCANASRQLNQKTCLEDYWDEEIGNKVSCTGYVQTYLLEPIDRNLVVSLDEIDVIFDYPDVAEDFLSLLREWHEEAKVQPIWERLRLVVTHSTEVYIPLNIHQSPFNVGLPIKLLGLQQPQIRDLAERYGLTYSDTEIESLMLLLGGHPYLIQQALYHLWSQKISLVQLLETAPTESGIYSNYLRHCLGHIQNRPELAAALKQVVVSSTPVQLKPVLIYQLASMGLVQFDSYQVKPSCELYRQYFSVNLF